MTDVTANASDGAESIGVYNLYGASPTLIHVDAYASNATNNYGLYNYESGPTVQYSVIRADTGTNRYGIYNKWQSISGVYIVTVDHSQIPRWEQHR